MIYSGGMDLRRGWEWLVIKGWVWVVIKGIGDDGMIDKSYYILRGRRVSGDICSKGVLNKTFGYQFNCFRTIYKHFVIK